MSKTFYGFLGKRFTWPDLPPGAPCATSITYDDVLLIPQPNTGVGRREEIDLSVKFGPYTLRVPIISAPMDTVSGETMISKLAELGAIGTLPRNDDFSITLSLCKKFTKSKTPCVYAVGLKNAVKEAEELQKEGAKIILLDVAHGGMKKVIQTASKVKESTTLTIILGNIVTYDQAVVYKQAGIDIARVGVGPGGACTTRLIAGNGFPQLSAIFETTSADIPVIADGGIRQPGDAAKALAAGARMIMLGSMFAGAEETPGEIINGMKEYRGQASASYMKDNGVSTNEFRAAEGISTQVPARGSVEHVVNNITGGVRSAMSYAGARNLAEFQEKAQFVLATQSVQRESQPHVVLR